MAKIPTDREFAAKGDLATARVVRALAWRLPIAFVTADSACGQEWRFRRMLEEAGVGYVLAVPKSQHVHAVGRIDFTIAQAPDEVWERHSCGEGAKGLRLYDWAAARLPAIADFDGDTPTCHRWVLARRSLARPDEIAYYLAYAPADTTVAELARIAGIPAGDRGSLPGREERMRPGPVQSPPLCRLVPPYHPGHARARLPGGDDTTRPSPAAATTSAARTPIGSVTNNRRPDAASAG